MKILDFLNILRAMVIAWPYSDGRLNTFSLFDSPSAFDTPNMGMTFSDYQEGFFWSRDWVNKGAVPGKLVKQYGILAVEVKQFTFRDSACEEAIYPVYINVLNQDDCAASKFKVDQINEEIIRNILRELREVREYTVTYTGSTVQRQWLTPYEVTLHEANGDISSIVGGQSLYGRIPGIDSAQVFRTFFGVDKIRSMAIRLDVQCNHGSNIGLNYGQVDQKDVWR